MNLLRNFVKSVSVAAVAALGVAAMGQTQGYVQKTRTVRAAVLILDSDTSGASAYAYTNSPFAFYNLDQATGVKPAGWSFVNPYAPGQVTEDIRDRYIGLFGAAGAPPLYAPVRKQNAAYWTTRLSQLSDSQMSNYDVLLVSPRFQLSLNPTERERLRRFVDGGGVLWIDTFGCAVDAINNAPLAFGYSSTTSGAGYYRDPASRLVNGLRRVSDSDLGLISLSTTANLGPPTLANPASYLPLVGEYSRYRAAIMFGEDPIVAQARLGDGTIVVSTHGIPLVLNRAASASQYLGTPPVANAAYTAQPAQLGADGRAAARFAVNVVGLSGGFRQPGGGTHKGASDASDTPAPVLSRFQVEGAFGPNDSLSTSPSTQSSVTYKGYVVATIGNRIAVFDAVPNRDLDGDGDPDDGIYDASGNVDLSLRDTSVGKKMDLVWFSPVIDPAGISAPVCAEVPDLGQGYAPALRGDPSDLILVTDSTGRVHIYLLNQVVGASDSRLIGGQHAENNVIVPLHTDQPSSPSASLAQYNAALGMKIAAPTVYDGIAYMADTTNSSITSPVGRVWAIDLTAASNAKIGRIMTSTYPWVLGGPEGGGTAFPAMTESATVGYIPSSDGADAAERVLYAPGVSTNSLQPTILSLWLGSKGEKPFSWDVNGNLLTITTRAGASGQVPIYVPPVNGSSPAQKQLGIRLSIVDSNGNPLSEGQMGSWVSGPPSSPNLGIIQYNWVGNKDDFIARGLSFRVDYSIDWGADPSQYSATIERGRLLLPIRRTGLGGGGDSNQRILGPIALTARGTMHLIEGTTNGGGGGSYFAIREDGGNRGQFRVVSRFALYAQHSETYDAVSSNVPPVLADSDTVIQGFTSGFPGYNPALSNFRYAGGVALRNGIAYATINANHGFIPVTMVAAFRAEPETPELRIGSALGNGAGLQQVDFQRNSVDGNGAPTGTIIKSALTTTQMTVDTTRGIIRLENLANVTRGEIQDCINLSQPVLVTYSNGTKEFRTPDAEGDLWTPLLWYGLWNGATAAGAPLVAGNEVYIAANSALPNILAGKGVVNSGVVWSIDADIPTSSVYSQANAARPWLVQALQIRPTGTANIDPSPFYRMPQNRGVTAFPDWVLRLEQTKIGSSTQAYGVAGGDGSVVAWGDLGLYGLSRADFLICDEGRLIRVDSSGNPVSSAFGGRFSGIGNGGTAANFKPLVRPVKAYPVGDNDYLVVDAGGNRVVRLDEDGTEIRSIDRFQLDVAHKPLAYRANEPLTLNDPRDATTYEGYVYRGATEIVSSQQPVEYWVRTIIADSGNGRIIELADRYLVDAQGRVGAPITLDGFDPVTGAARQNVPQVGVLVWQSPSLEQSTKIGDYYNSISRVYIGNATTGRYVYVAGVSRTRPTRSSAGLDNPNAAQRPAAAAGGAIVLFDPLGGVRVFDRFGLPNTTNTPFFRASNAAGTQGAFATTTGANQPGQNDRPFTNLQAVSTSTVVANGQVSVRLMATDVDAVYEFIVDAATIGDATKDPTQAATGGGSLNPSWYINEAAYTALRRTNLGGGQYDVGANPLSFRPAYARRLDSGEVLIVNGYRGLTRNRNAEYKGEVLVLDGSTAFNLGAENLGFKFSDIHFDLSTLNDSARDLVSPVFADRK